MRTLVKKFIFLSFPFFFAYPLATIFPTRTYSLIFHISLPIWSIYSIISLLYLFYNLRFLNKKSLSFIFTFIFFIFLSSALYYKNISIINPIFDLLGFIFIPFAMAIFYYKSKSETRVYYQKIICLLFFLYCILNLFHGAWQSFFNFDIVCLAGNRNWCSTSLLVLCPLAIVFLFINKKVNKNIFIILSSFILVFSIFLIIKCESRGTILALLSFLFLYLFLNLKLSLRIFLFLFPVLFILWYCIFSTDKVVQSINEDIRIPLWWNAVQLIVDKPLGVGAGNFRKEFVKYRSNAQKQRLVSAPITEHPHNEFLNISIQGGILAGVLWLFLALFILYKNKNLLYNVKSLKSLFCNFSDNELGSLIYILSYFGFFIIFMHSFFDKVLVQPPTNVLAMFFEGILLSRCNIFNNNIKSSKSNNIQKIIKYSFFLIALLYLLNLTYREIMRGVLFRKAYLSEINKDYKSSYNNYLESQRFEPYNIKTHFLAGVVALEKLRNPRLALPHLSQTFREDPNYARVNMELGLAFGLLGEDKKANFFLKRSSYLFPYDDQVFNLLFINQILLKDFKNAEKTDEYLTILLNLRNIQYLKRYNIKENKIVNKFLKSMKTKGEFIDFKNSVATLLSPLARQGRDPLLRKILNKKSLNIKQFSDLCTIQDFLYWQNIFKMKKISTLVGINTGKFKQKSELLQKTLLLQEVTLLINRFTKNVPNLSSESKKNAFQYPATIWNNKKGSMLEICFTFASYMYQNGFDIIFFTNKNITSVMKTKSNINFIIEKQGYFFSGVLGNSYYTRLDIKLLALTLSSQNISKYDKKQFYIFTFLQEFFLKNQLLAKRITKMSNGKDILLPRTYQYPSLRLYNYKEKFAIFCKSSNISLFLNPMFTQDKE